MREDNKLFLGTHMDTLAKTAGRTDNVDTASLADFVLNGGAVTYPYTVYKDIYLALPASITIETADRVLTTETYWFPEETNPYKNINEAATALRESLKKHVNRITENMKEVAQFLSGGEDSRTLLGLIPSDLKRDAFIFLDSMNREGRTPLLTWTLWLSPCPMKYICDKGLLPGQGDSKQLAVCS